MSRSRWLLYAALGCWLTITPVPLQADSSEEHPPDTAEKHQAANGGIPISNNSPSPSVSGDNSEPVSNADEDSSDNSDDYTRQDLIAQQQMAVATNRIVGLTRLQIGVAIFGLVLGAFTVAFAWWAGHSARRAVDEAEQATKAARESVVQAQRQADAAILLESAKLVSHKARLTSAPGEPNSRQDRGIPTNGMIPEIILENFGKTAAFMKGYAAFSKVSVHFNATRPISGSGFVVHSEQRETNTDTNP